MKKLFMILIVCGFALFVWFSNNNARIKTEVFTDTNIEALASGETGSSFLCVGSGSLDCRGSKVQVIIRNFSIE